MWIFSIELPGRRKVDITIRFTLSQPSYSLCLAVRFLSSNSPLGFLIDNLPQHFLRGKKKSFIFPPEWQLNLPFNMKSSGDICALSTNKQTVLFFSLLSIYQPWGKNSLAFVPPWEFGLIPPRPGLRQIHHLSVSVYLHLPQTHAVYIQYWTTLHIKFKLETFFFPSEDNLYPTSLQEI